MSQELSKEREAYFPQLQKGAYAITSSETGTYNCIAHAAGRSDFWWWPDEGPGIHWPDGVDKKETLECFIQAYATEGYVACEYDGALEAGFEKIAIYVDANGEPTHAARQLSNGRWTSKLGDWEDIEHDSLQVLEDDENRRGLGYGRAVQIMKRPNRE